MSNYIHNAMVPLTKVTDEENKLVVVVSEGLAGTQDQFRPGISEMPAGQPRGYDEQAAGFRSEDGTQGRINQVF